MFNKYLMSIAHLAVASKLFKARTGALCDVIKL
ncbi:hypothetical protein QO002_003098 [Pararhizobium capsulatum DSM 1112]|uniref:Uncharacterized protein n=1 Tax=Pararhizobium capsulatum DSM 1112 TaxID=1121113 RepID=A0ABU0BU24_9HYPH|nr:hypothetical protein [Pararhizobium capsulatum DSM 1112]